MKVFISWSGEKSKGLAEILKVWLPSVIQMVKPYYSPDDVAKGSRWGSEISKELEESRIGILCLTRDNLSAPWIMFEAGALSKNIDKSKVCPILFGVEPSDIQGPLVQFQAVKFEEADIKRLITTVNSELGEKGLSSDVLDAAFQMWWPKLKEKVEALAASQSDGSETEIRTDRDVLEEILQLTRSISQQSIQQSLPGLWQYGAGGSGEVFVTHDASGKVVSTWLGEAPGRDFERVEKTPTIRRRLGGGPITPTKAVKNDDDTEGQ